MRTRPLTDSCECGRPDVGPKHCPIHGDGKAPEPVVAPAATGGRKASTRRGRPAKNPK